MHKRDKWFGFLVFFQIWFHNTGNKNDKMQFGTYQLVLDSLSNNQEASTFWPATRYKLFASWSTLLQYYPKSQQPVELLAYYSTILVMKKVVEIC